MNFEQEYLRLGMEIINEGEEVTGRNGVTRQLFGRSLVFDMMKEFPIITTRKSFYKSALGEFAAFMNAPFDNIQHMKDFGVNYWDLWSGSTGNLNIDYGNEGERKLNANGDTQMSEIIRLLKDDPHSRRIILNYWNPDHLYDTDNPLSLPCCWYSIQFHVRKNRYLDIVWNQRSADWAIGVQADAILASMFSLIIGNQVGLLPGRVVMNFGNAHLYKEHWDDFKLQALRIPYDSPNWTFRGDKGMDYKEFRPDMFELLDYEHHSAIKYLLKA